MSEVRSVTLTAHTNSDTLWDQTWEDFTKFARELGEEYCGISLSTYVIGDAEDEKDPEKKETVGEYYDEYTLFKVVVALRNAGIPDGKAEEAINYMQNAGILFRERS